MMTVSACIMILPAQVAGCKELTCETLTAALKAGRAYPRAQPQWKTVDLSDTGLHVEALVADETSVSILAVGGWVAG